MKKLFLLLTIVFGFLSCEGPMGPEGPKGPPGEGTGWKIKYMTVYERNWEKIQSGKETYYRAIIEDKDLTQYIYDEGALTVHQILDFDTQDEVQTALPYVFHRVDDDGYEWTETLYYDYRPGTIAFYLTFSDGIPRNPVICDFKVTMLWPQ